ncbi:MAG: hypothetical protein MI976_04175 [Pseudomonadales bacterium]|nr:hypothetical protein [Pseudomonadales bacterium]
MRVTVIFVTLFAVNARAEIAVIVNAHNDTPELENRDVINLFMGRNLYFEDGSLAFRLDQSPTSATRQEFYQTLMGKSVAEINAYWARLLFTGRASPPQTLSGAESVLEAVRKNINAIGYVNAEDLDGSVKVVARVK